MYTSYIGNIFVAEFNARNGTDLSCEQFFLEEMVSMFFNRGKNLMHIHNSTYHQPLPKKGRTGCTEGELRLLRLLNDISNGVTTGSTLVGYAAGDITNTSTGQVSSIPFKPPREDYFASWIGQALALGIEGGYLLLINKPKLLWYVYEGWIHYSTYISHTPGLKDKQIETWNGQWLCHRCSDVYQPLQPMLNFEVPINKTASHIAIPTQRWIAVVGALASLFGGSVAIVYAYNLSQTNNTLGFFNVDLKAIHSLSDIKRRFVKESNFGVNSHATIKLYDTFYSFHAACLQGVIDLRVLEPAGLRQYMPTGTNKQAKGKMLRFTLPSKQQITSEDEASYIARLKKESEKYQHQVISYLTYKTWIAAMINNRKELNVEAEKLASVLISLASQKTERGKTGLSNHVKTLLDTKGLKDFIDEAGKIIMKDKNADHANILKDVKDELIKLPSDLFPLFITLVRFEYQVLTTK